MLVGRIGSEGRDDAVTGRQESRVSESSRLIRDTVDTGYKYTGYVSRMGSQNSQETETLPPARNHEFSGLGNSQAAASPNQAVQSRRLDGAGDA